MPERGAFCKIDVADRRRREQTLLTEVADSNRLDLSRREKVDDLLPSLLDSPTL